MFSLCGYNTAAGFADVNDEDIDYVEKFTRKNIPEMINLNQMDNEHFTTEQKKIFFGMFATEPTKFEFTRGNKNFIGLIVTTVKEIIESERNRQAGLAKFNKQTKTKWFADLYRTPIGLFFADGLNFEVQNTVSTTKASTKIKKPQDQQQLKKNLFEKAEKVMSQHKMGRPLFPFSEDSVSVNIENGTLVKGTVICNFCNIDDPKRIVKMYCQQSMGSGYWVPSNLTSHLTKHHSNKQQKSNIETISAYNNNLEGTKSEYISSSEEIEVEMVHQTEQNRSLTLEIVPVLEYEVENLIEDSLFLQMSKHNIQMINGSLINNEKIVDFFVQIDSELKPSSVIKICKIEGDGSCLYGSLSHQLFSSKINSCDHRTQTINLRKDCVDYLQSNLERMEPYIKGQVYEMCDKRKINTKNIDLKQEILNFTKITLPSANTYGGMESIKSISELYKVNIITINEDGSCHIGAFNVKYERMAFIAFRNGNHYDSVVEIDTKTLSMYAHKLASDISRTSIEGELHSID